MVLVEIDPSLSCTLKYSPQAAASKSGVIGGSIRVLLGDA